MQCRAGSTKWVVVFRLSARYMVLGPCLQAPQSEQSPKVRKLCVALPRSSLSLQSWNSNTRRIDLQKGTSNSRQNHIL